VKITRSDSAKFSSAAASLSLRHRCDIRYPTIHGLHDRLFCFESAGCGGCGDPVKQEKKLKYASLVANTVMRSTSPTSPQ